MPSYQVFFFGSLFFLAGIFLKSIGLSTSIAVGVLLGAGLLLIFWKIRHRRIFLWFSLLILLTLVGAVYYEWDNGKLYERYIVFSETITFSGVVEKNPVIRNDVQELVVRLETPYLGNVLVKSGLHPRFRYGDKLEFQGSITEPSYRGYANYLAKDGISGIVYFPHVTLISSDNGSSVKAWLYGVRSQAQQAFERVLHPREAAFLNGITFGGYSGFTPEFKDAMSRSGTTHLVALSGYNISIIIWAAMGVLLYFFSRRLSFVLTILLIVGFVVMTGAEASVVRAAVMGSLVILAQGVGRIYDMRNALMFAALVMVLGNPKVLVFDVGFQLSFLAVLGIIYLKPALQRFFRTKKEETSFLSWRDNLFTTASAQLAVAPLLITNFGHFSLTSLLANVAILELIPVTMAIGFGVAFAAFLSYYASLVLGWVAGVLLSIEVGLIHIFSVLSIPLHANLGWGGVMVYYGLLIGFVYVIQRRRPRYV